MATSDTKRRNAHVGGQGMGQGRGMNPGEVHHRTDPVPDNDQKGGERSNKNKPATKDQDEKGMGHPRNR